MADGKTTIAVRAPEGVAVYVTEMTKPDGTRLIDVRAVLTAGPDAPQAAKSSTPRVVGGDRDAA